MLDLKLPDGDGIQLLQDLRVVSGVVTPPVVVVSACAGEMKHKCRGDALVIVDWIPKPVDRDRLNRALQKILSSYKKPRVLHVEDDLDVIQVTRTLLEELGQIDYVTSLKQARQQIEKYDYDLLLLDVSLPDGSGLDLLDELNDYCPVVIFSGMDTDSGESEKVAAALTKSKTDSEKLIRTVRRVLNQSISKHQGC